MSTKKSDLDAIKEQVNVVEAYVAELLDEQQSYREAIAEHIEE